MRRTSIISWRMAGRPAPTLRWSATAALLLGVVLSTLACGSDSGVLVGEDRAPRPLNRRDRTLCTDETVSVTASVSTGTQVVFDWDPNCMIARLVVEEAGGGDRWVVSTDENTWFDPGEANRMAPPITYGEQPIGIRRAPEAPPLEEGVAYTLVLWRVLPPETAERCAVRVDNACRLAAQGFNR